MAVISIFTASKRAGPNKCAALCPYVEQGRRRRVVISLIQHVCFMSLFGEISEATFGPNVFSGVRDGSMDGELFSWTPLIP